MFSMLPVLEKFLYRSTLGSDEEEVEDILAEEEEEEDEVEDEEYDCDDPNDEDYEPSEQDGDDEQEDDDDDEQDGDDEQSSNEQDENIPSMYETTAINLLVNFHWITSQFQVWWMQVYKTNSWKNACTNALYSFSKKVYDSAINLFTFCKTEPTDVAWLCESSLVINQRTVRLELVEKYYHDKYIQQFENMCDGMQDAVDHFSYMHYIVKENLILYKFAEDGYMSRTFIKGNTEISPHSLQTGPILSNVRFLSIQYSHPSMKDDVFLNIPRGMYYCGNHILSAAHVFRLLQYQSADYVFDTQYTLLLLDSDVKEYQLTSTQYVRVEKDYMFISTVQQ